MLPYFIGIGAMRSGSSWLYSNLREHPEIYMPPKKEIHYFDGSPKYSSRNLPRFTTMDNIENRIKYLKDLIKRRLDDEKKWYYRFPSNKYNDRWYESLFRSADKTAKCGEITPDYAILEKEDVKRVYALIPKVKIIYTMRDPVDRAWSHFKLHIRKSGKGVEEYSPREIKGFIDSDTQSIKGDYLRTLDNWLSVFPGGQMFIGYFDEICDDPKKFMCRVFEYLRCRVDDEIVKNIRVDKVLSSNKADMPEEIRRYLNDKYRGMIKELSNRYKGYPLVWLNRL
jgi:sulfotransferase family protein